MSDIWNVRLQRWESPVTANPNDHTAGDQSVIQYARGGLDAMNGRCNQQAHDFSPGYRNGHAIAKAKHRQESMDKPRFDPYK
ncbi:MAG: hypothetical protein QF486_00485 [Candidatus Woesearchaeota archaeon]|jgi:hypothetical protein|nr:hypothetical protein [Candidatus Woesearchaeota archaeon]MDP7181300.1 hypothetical protein [Candidatus Woesearchaeota archaeon]MDP7198081.1 hypothetical protein [Candidatus Woesearchaeota archaeon]MDP7466915.1 hypothetical protein [Candidatus Woesearchaeota archaeon]MDP7647350.1 hypothetical protein [Candidatus Woesearchaeota archaeon]